MRAPVLMAALAVAACAGKPGGAADPDGGPGGACPDPVIAPPGFVVELDPAEVTLHLASDEAVQLSARAGGQDVTTGAVIDGCPTPTAWVSAYPEIATVDGGLVRPGDTLGMTWIQAVVAGSRSAPARVFLVPSATITELVIDPTSAEVAAGGQLELRATATYADGVVQDVTELVAWASADPDRLEVDAQGRCTAIAAGPAQVTATRGGVTAVATVQVLPPVPVGLVLAPDPVVLCARGSRPVTVSGLRLSDGSVTAPPPGEPVWSVSGFTMRIDEAGLVTALGPFSGTATAAIDDLTGSAAITASDCPGELTVDPTEATLTTGGELQLTAQAFDADDDATVVTGALTWTSSAPEVAAVLATPGRIRAVAPGLATVTGWDPDTGWSVTAAVEVVDAPALPTCTGDDLTWTGNLRLTTSADVEAIRGCTTITGALIIAASELADLAGLESLTAVGALTIRLNPELTDVSGLASLAAVGGTIHLGDNPALAALTGLGALREHAGDLVIERNGALTDLRGLDGLRAIGGELRVSNNPALVSLAGLDALERAGALTIHGSPGLASVAALAALTEVDGVLTLDAGAALDDLTGLEALTAAGGVALRGSGITSLVALDGLTEVGSLELARTGLTSIDGLAGLAVLTGALVLGQNPGLVDVDGLAGLTSVGGAVLIAYNGSLLDLDGLAGVKEVGGDLAIYYNDDLTSVAGLAGVDTPTGERFDILSNPALPTCAAEALLAAWLAAGFTGTAAIDGNADLHCP